MSERLTDKDSRILWEAIGAQSASVVTVRAVERIVEAHVAEALAPVLALAESLVEELVECRSFISVETRHYPTVTALSEVIDNACAALRAAAGTPTRDTTEEDADE